MNEQNQEASALDPKIKELLMLALFYWGFKTTNKLIKYGLIGGFAYSIWKAKKEGSLGGYGINVDTDMAVDLLFPKMKDHDKMWAKVAAKRAVERIL